MRNTWSSTLAAVVRCRHPPAGLPGAVDAEIWDRPGAEPSAYDGPNVPVREVPVCIADANDSEAFEYYIRDKSHVCGSRPSRSTRTCPDPSSSLPLPVGLIGSE